MVSPLDNINKLSEEFRQVLSGNGGTAHQARGLLHIVGSFMGAYGGSVTMWQVGGVLALNTTWGLDKALARKIRRVVANPPTCPGEPLVRMGTNFLKAGDAVKSGWLALDNFLEETAKETFLAAIHLPWAQGSGLCLLFFEEQIQWDKHEIQAISNLLTLALSSAVHKNLATQHSDDYRRIFRNSKDMIYLSSRDGKWLEVNPAGVEMLGYGSEDELLAVPDIAKDAYMRAKDRRVFMEEIERQGFVQDYYVTFKKKDGSPIDVSITSQVRYSNGKIVGYEGIIKDITRRKRAEASAAQQQQMLETILEVMPVAVFVLDKDHTVKYWNNACEEMTGWTKADIIDTNQVWKVFHRPLGVSLADNILDQDHEKMNKVYGKEKLRPSEVAEDAWEAEAHFGNLGGRERDLFFTAAALKDRCGNIIGAVEAIVDASRTKNLERQLAQSEQMYRTLVESNREGIALHDQNTFIFVNTAFLDMFGLVTVANQKIDFLEMLDPEYHKDYLDWLNDVFDEVDEQKVFEGQGLREGKPFDLEMTAGLTSYDSKPAILFNVRDVTFRKSIEEQLIRSERLAATGKLAFDVAHEVNNPLGGILTYAHLMAEDIGEKSELYPTVDKIIKLTNRCKIIVRGLLDFARREDPGSEAMDINRVLREMLNLMAGHMILRNVEIVLELDQGLPYFYGHRSKLEQVFLNMLVNAAEAMEGRGRIFIQTKANADGTISVCFEDTGPGMDEHIARRVFEPFFTTKERGRGTGLGLSISHGIIKQHGGNIVVKSAKGVGAKFTITLPKQKDKVVY